MASSFYDLFSNATLANFSISTYTFQMVRSLGVLTVNNKNYNLALDENIGVYVFDENWNYLNLLNFTALNSYPAYYMIVVNGGFYFSSLNTYGLIQTTSQLGLLNVHANETGKYRSLCYDQMNKTVIAANVISNRIDIFSQDLTLLSSLSLAFQPHGVCVYGSSIYVSYWSGSSNISVINNGNFTTLCPEKLISLTVDSFGYMAVSCQNNSILYLYHVNGSYMNKSISTATLLFYANYDAQNFIAIGANNKIFVY